MKRNLLLFFYLMLLSPTVFAAPFSPTLLKLSADAEIQYDFDGSVLEIPVTVTGTSASPLYFLVHTKGIGSTVPNMRNGYLGWHHVCKIDTCVYLSPEYNFGIGKNTVTWDGKDDDGTPVPEGEYTYYMWAMDSLTPKQRACQWQSPYGMRRTWFQDVDEAGVLMNNPWYCELIDPTARWELGSDPQDEAARVTTLIQQTADEDKGIEEINILPEGFKRPHVSIGLNHPDDFDYFYMRLGNPETEVGAIVKWKFVPYGKATIDTDFGDNGYGMLISSPYQYEPGVVSDGNYIYGGDQNQKASMDPDAELYFVNWDGTIEEEFDLREWWSRPDEFKQGQAMNSGPDTIRMKNGIMALGCYCSCIKQLVDPARYMESGDREDMFLWSNLNGDYILDQNFEDTATVIWACNYPVTAFQYTFDLDSNMFAFSSAYDHGAVSFGLLGPDGTGIGWMSFQGETGGWKKGTLFLDSDTPFDGIYCDNDKFNQANYATEGLWWVGYDSIKGIISSQGNTISAFPEHKGYESRPEQFVKATCYPNPFNPQTTIQYEMSHPGKVKVSVFNSIGQRVRLYEFGHREQGIHELVFDATELTSGLYFYCVDAGYSSIKGKMLFLK